MSHIITRGLGGSTLITSGFGGKWKPLRSDHTTRIEFCPCCKIPLKNNIYFTYDVLRPSKKIYRCKVCFCILELQDGHWVKVGQPFVDNW